MERNNLKILALGLMVVVTLVSVNCSRQEEHAGGDEKNPHGPHEKGEDLTPSLLQGLPSGKALDDLYQACLSKANSYDKTLCLKPYFQALAYQGSASKAIARAEEIKNSGVIEDCHLIAHIVGEVHVIKEDFDIGKSLSTCPMSCVQGCFHGVMQTYVSRKFDPSKVVEDLRSACDSVSGDKVMRHQCVHGVGHGFLTAGFLPMKDAIRSCLFFGGAESQTCLQGLFMENMKPYLLRPESDLLDALPNICAEVVQMNNPAFTLECITAIGEGLMFYTGHDLEGSFILCDKLPGEHQKSCKEGALVEAKLALPEFNLKSCDFAPEYQAFCKQLIEAG